MALVPISNRATGHGGGQTCSRVRGAKNLWVGTGCVWNIDLGTYKAGTLGNECNFEILFEELDVNWA